MTIKGSNRWETFRDCKHTKTYVIIRSSVNVFYHIVLSIYCSSKEFSGQCRRCTRSRFNPWVRKICGSRKWQPTPVFFPGEVHGQRSQAGYNPWGCQELDTTDQLTCIYILLHVYAAAAAAKSLQSCPTLCDPIDGSPPGFPVPGIHQARTLEWVAIAFSNA